VEERKGEKERGRRKKGRERGHVTREESKRVESFSCALLLSIINKRERERERGEALEDVVLGLSCSLSFVSVVNFARDLLRKKKSFIFNVNFFCGMSG